MANDNKQGVISSTFTKEIIIIDPYQTANATQATAMSFPLPASKAAFAKAEFFCYDSSFASTAGGTVQAMFVRSAGNISRSSGATAAGLITSILGNFTLGQPSVDLVSNTTTQSIDVKVTGKTATTINWRIELTIYYNS